MARLNRSSVAVAEAGTGEMLREFEEEYRRVMRAQGVARDAEELAVCNELLRRAERGEHPQDGDWHIVSTRDDIDWASDEAMLALKPEGQRTNQTLLGIGMLAGIVVLAWFLLFRGGGGNGNGNGSAQSAGPAASQTALALALASSTSSIAAEQGVSATQTALALVTPQWGGPNISVGADARDYLAPVYPQTLELDGVAFRVYPSNMEGGRWEYQDLDGTASWIAGSVINWSFGVPDTAGHISLFARLADGVGEKTAILRLSSGVVKRFKLQKPVHVGRQQIEVFAPYSPGLTVVLLGDRQGKERWLVRGREEYADEDSESSPTPSIMPTPSPISLSPP